MGFTNFHWQSGYGAFSVSPSHVPALKEYIANQEDHHKKESFQDEFRRLCEIYGIPIDERYVWDCAVVEPFQGSRVIAPYSRGGAAAPLTLGFGVKPLRGRSLHV